MSVYVGRTINSEVFFFQEKPIVIKGFVWFNRLTYMTMKIKGNNLKDRHKINVIDLKMFWKLTVISYYTDTMRPLVIQNKSLS